MITTNSANSGPRGRHVKNASEVSLQIFHDDESTSVFDLGGNYQSAVDCLIQCQSIIEGLQTRLAAKDEELLAKNERISSLEKRLSLETASIVANRNENALREEIAAKDEQITCLEDKLIEMSFELASLKADDDRQINGLKRRISSIENVEEEAELDVERTTPPRRQSSQQPSSFVDKEKEKANCCASPATMIGREEPSHRRRRNPRHQRALSQSWSGMDEALPPSKQVTSFSEVERRHPREGESRHNASWRGVDTTAWPSKQLASFSEAKRHDPPLVKQARQERPARVRRLSSLARQMSFSNVKDVAPLSPDNSDGAALDDSGKASRDSTGSLCHDWPHNSSSRRLSNIGQFILNRTTERSASVADMSITKDHGRTSAPSQPERLSCVIFPVSSDDCLVGLCRDAEMGEGEAHARSRRLENGPIDW